MPRAVDLADAGPPTARIALVDDDPTFLRVFAANLQAAGYQSLCFDGGDSLVGHTRKARRAGEGRQFVAFHHASPSNR